MKNILFVLFSIWNSSVLFAQTATVFGLGNAKNVTVSSSSNDATGIRTLMSSGFLPNDAAASRLLSQATLGASLSQIQTVAQLGNEAWLDNQLNLSNTFKIETYLQALHQSIVDSLKAINPSGTYTLANTSLSNWHFDVSWFQGAMTASDQLRWRVGLGLSEIFVTSRVSAFDGNPYALASYYDVLMDNAFGNYRTLLDKITYHPSMAVYLTFMNNHATDTLGTANKIYPDENYAREIMQLFSIGLYELNMDGTEKKDANNKSIPTYTNADISGLAKVFTGLSWGDSRYLGDNSKDNWSYTKRLKFFALDSSDAKRNTWKTNPRIVNGHEPGTKTFLNNTIISRPVQQGELDIQDALNIIFNHSNVPPFVARRLIQRLVTSNPSSAYIGRVAAVFANNGSGVRGDLKAVIRAVLLDPEARDCCADKSSTSVGMLREPFLRYMNLVKGLNLTAASGKYRNVMESVYNKIEQKPMYSPTVFNFFSPDYIPDGELKAANKYGPEFQLLNSQSLSGYHNGLSNWLINDDPTEFWYLFNGEKYKADQDPKFDLSADYVLTKNNRLPEFLDKYNLILAAGKLSKESLQIIQRAIEGMPYSEDASGVPSVTEANRRARIAIYLILTSPDYLINR